MTQSDVYNALIGYHLPEGVSRTMAAVAVAESGLNPGAVGDGKTSIGLFQIHLPAHGDKLAKWTGSSDPETWKSYLSDPENNIFAATEILKSQGLGAWSAYTSGAYEPYMAGGDPIPNPTGTNWADRLIDRLKGYAYSGPAKKAMAEKGWTTEQYQQNLADANKTKAWTAIGSNTTIIVLVVLGLLALVFLAKSL